MHSEEVIAPKIYKSLYNKIKFKEKAHEKFLKLIADFKTRGFTYDEVLNNQDLRIIRNIVASKFGEGEMYPYYNKIVTYVYTRDEICNPFGVWVKYNFFLPLACFEYAKNLLLKKKRTDISSKKLAGLIFSLICIEPRMKVEKGKITILRKPNLLYQIAGISQKSFKKYAEIINCKYEYKTVSVDGSPKSFLAFSNLKKAIQKISFQTLNIQNRYLKTIDKPNFINGINFYTGKFKEISSNYEVKYLRGKKSYFNYRSLENNPFIRVQSSFPHYNLYTQLYLLRYDIILRDLYLNNRKLLRQFFHKGDRSLILRNHSKRLDSLKKYLIRNGINAEVFAISSPKDFNVIGEHFQQIKQSYSIADNISKNGIFISSIKLNELLMKYEEEKAEIERDLLKNNGFLFDFDEKNEGGMPSQNQSSRYHKVLRTIKELMDIQKTIKQQGYEDGRLRGLFIPHGANTHRMSCSRYNLQGISREVRKQLFTVPSGWKLLSADVSGQDIAVAANLAGKMFLGYPFASDNEKKIGETLKKLSLENSQNMVHKPIDRITNLLMEGRELSKFPNRKNIRNAVKKIIYTTSYGGGINTIIDNKKLKFLNYVNENLRLLQLPGILSNYSGLSTIANYEDIEHQLIEMSRLEIKKNLTRTIFPRHFKLIKEHSKKLIEEYKEVEVWISEVKLLYTFIIETMHKEYPGIIEAFGHYHKYTEVKKLTYPTLLGWQTVPELLSNEYIRTVTTRSRSYTIQASGAEFLRQWLIELSKVNGYNRDFIIVNAIHDQVILEVKDKAVNRLSKELLTTASSAAAKVGLIPETIKIPEIVITDPG